MPVIALIIFFLSALPGFVSSPVSAQGPSPASVSTPVPVISPPIVKRITTVPPSGGVKFDTDTANRIKLTINHTKILAPLSNFPILVHLSASSGSGQADISSIFSVLGENSKKISVTTSDKKTECFVEIEIWDNVNKQAWLWVKVPEISSTEDTVIYLFFDRNQADNSSMVGETGSLPAEKVWSDRFVMVQHFDDSSTGKAGEYIDSTSCHNDGTGYGLPVQKAGKVANAQYFDGDDDYILVPDSDDFSIGTQGELTVSWWFGPTVLNWRKNDGSGDYINMLGKGGYPNGWEWVFGLGLQNSRNKPQQINLYAHNAPGGKGIGSGTSDHYEVGDWIYVVGRFSKNNVDILDFYPSGLKTSTNVYTKATGYADAIIPKHTWSPLTIATVVTQWQMYEGLIDELYISSTYRSDAWIKASYYSQIDSLLTYTLVREKPLTINPIGNKTVEEGHSISFTVTAIGTEGNLLTVSASGLPRGAVFNPDTGTFFWTPASGQRGTYSKVHFEVTDGKLTDSEDITIVVTAANVPEPSIPSTTPGQASGTAKSIFIVIGVMMALIAALFIVVIIRRRRS